jgi:hypothetical protein
MIREGNATPAWLTSDFNASLEVIDLLFQGFDAGCLFGHGKDHGLNIIRELDLGSRHGSDHSIFCPDPPAVSGP